MPSIVPENGRKIKAACEVAELALAPAGAGAKGGIRTARASPQQLEDLVQQDRVQGLGLADQLQRSCEVRIIIRVGVQPLVDWLWWPPTVRREKARISTRPKIWVTPPGLSSRTRSR